MSQVRVCDKCNKVLKCVPSVKISVYNGIIEYELCEECKFRLVKWMEEKVGGTKRIRSTE